MIGFAMKRDRDTCVWEFNNVPATFDNDIFCHFGNVLGRGKIVSVDCVHIERFAFGIESVYHLKNGANVSLDDGFPLGKSHWSIRYVHTNVSKVKKRQTNAANIGNQMRV